MDIIPGNVDLSQYKSPTITSLTSLSLSRGNKQKKTILLASNIIDDNSIFMNGLGQNILLFYNLFESLGHTSYLIQYNGAPGKTLEYYNVITPNDLIRKNIHIDLYIEIGMSLDPTARQYLRSIGAKIVKIYLGNILNIDIEAVQSFKNIFFNHHLVGEVDDIWMSPHYLQNLEYGLGVNQVSIKKGRIVPYVWDPQFIGHKLDKLLKWIAPKDWRDTDIIITDPNISFQKSSFYSLLLTNSFAKKCNEWRGNVIVINGDKIQNQLNFSNFVLPSLVYLKNRVKLLGRKDIQTIMTEYSNGCFITSQFTNPFNYMTLELMYCGFPIVHNSEGWEQFGYYYSINKWDEAVCCLENAVKNHMENVPIYKSHCANLLWRHSIHNPEIQTEWESIIQIP